MLPQPRVNQESNGDRSHSCNNQNSASMQCKECDKIQSVPSSNNSGSLLERSNFLSSLRVKRTRFKRADSFDTLKSVSKKLSNSSSQDEVNHCAPRPDSASSRLNRALGSLRIDKQVKASSLGDLSKSCKDEAGVRSCVFAAMESEVADCGGGHSYLYAPLLPNDGNLVDAVVLSTWDNIVGPKATFVWTRRGSEDNTNTTGKFVAHQVIHRLGGCPSLADVQAAIEYAVGHTLHGELDRNCSSGNINTEMYIVADKGFVLAAVTFGASHWGRPQEITPHSLVAVIPFLQLSKFIDVQSLVNLWLEKLAYSFRVLLYKFNHAEALSRASVSVLEFANVMSSLTTGNLMASKRSDTYLFRDPFADENFVKKAITSHLQTCGCSVVIGESIEKVNMMVRTLALFLTPSEKSLVRLVTCGSGPNQRRSAYTAGLMVQGVLGDHLATANIQMDDVLRSQYPTTLVNVSNEQVLRSRFPPEHGKQRRVAIRADVEKQLQSSTPSTSRSFHLSDARRIHGQVPSPNPPLTQTSTHITKSILQAVTDVGPLVRNIFGELRMIAGCCDPNWEEGAVGKFLRQLEYRALTLILYVQSSQRQPFEYVNGKLVKGTAPVASYSRKQLRRCLDLEDEGDFRIVIAVAEKLKPGIYEFVMTAYHP